MCIDKKSTKILNKSGGELVKSAYLNSYNNTVLLISIEISQGVVGQMKCRQY